MQTALARLYFGARSMDYDFKMVATPDNVQIGNDPLAVDPKQTRAALGGGRALAKQPDPCSSAPSNFGDIPGCWRRSRIATNRRLSKMARFWHAR